MASINSQTSIIENLLEHTSDKSEKVKVSIYSSLKRIALCYPSEVISAAIRYRRRNPKLNNNEVRSIFELIKNVCEERLSKVENTLLVEIISSAIEESLKASVVPFISADLLPVIGSKYCKEVLNELQKCMVDGVAPHASVIYTLGHLAVANMTSFHTFSMKIFEYLLSILQVTKTDNMRKLYAQTVCQLVETIIELTSTEESSVTKEQYSRIVEEIFDTFMTTWLQSKDPNTCEMITQAAGSLVLLFSDQKLTNDTLNILNSFLLLYKKPSSTFPRYIITQGVSNFLSVVPRAALQPHLDTLMNTLHLMVVITPDFSQPITVKNHNEILRCYDYLSTLFGDKIIEVLLNNLRSSSEHDRIAGLIVATYLLNSSSSILKPKISELISVLHKLLNESSTKINKNMATIINVLAFRGYLTEKDAVFIEFLARHSYHSSSTNVEQDDLESSCKNTLAFLNTASSAVQSLCWKVLMQLMMNGEHLQAVAVFAKSLAYLISKCELSVLERNCYDRSEIIFVRVMSLLGSPLHDNRGIYLLNFLNDYIKWKVKVDPLIWKTKMTELIAYLTASDSAWNDAEWENKILNSLTASFTDDTKPWLEAVNIEAIKLLGENQGNADANSNNIAVDERAMLFKLIALLSQYIDEASIVTSNITKILSPLSQRSLIDLKACSRSVGIISRSHFNQIFNELDKFQRTELNRKPTKFLGLIKDTKGETEIEIIRRMICECFSAILVEAPPRAMLPKFKQLMHWFISLHQITKDAQTLNACTEALFHVSEVLLKNENDFEKVDECRKELLSFITSTVQTERIMPSVMCLKTIATLFKLSSSTSATEKLHLLQKCLNKMFQYYSISSSTSAITEAGVIEVDPIIQQLCILIENSVDTKNSTVLEEIVMFLRQWLSHKIINHRIVSLFLLKSALNSYVICYFNDTKNYVKFTSVGSLLGRLYVRSFESNSELSRLACECIILLFAIAEANVDNASTSVEDIHKSMMNVERVNIEFFRVSVYCKLTPEQLYSFTTELLNGLLDIEDPCAIGTANLLTVLFSELGTQFHRHALEIFGDMIIKLMKLENKTILEVAVNAMLALARHAKDMFVSTMLNQTIPFHPNISLCWSRISVDENFADEVLKRLYETLKNHPTYDEDAKNKKRKVLSRRPLVAISAICEILSSMNDTVVLATSHFIDFFPLLLTLIPVYMGESAHHMNINNSASKVNKDTTPPLITARLVFDTLLVLMKRSRCVDADDSLLAYAEKIDFRTEAKTVYFEMVKHLAKNVSRFSNEIVSKILDTLGGFVGDDKKESQRATAVIFCVEIFNLKCCEDAILVDTVILNLLSFLNDTSYFVRENSLKGLANISNLEFSLVERYKERLLSALTTGFEDNEATTQIGIIIQSLRGLSKLLPFLTSGQYASICISIAIRIRPFFEKENVEVRSLSLRLFGELATVPSIEVSSFREQVTSNLLCLLFHLGEKEPEVVESCRFTLRTVAKTMKSKFLAEEMVKYLNEETKISHNEYLERITKILAEDFAEKFSDFINIAISYTKSSWPEIRASAVLFIGTMYSNQMETQDKLPVDVLTGRILALLKDIDANVRANAATSLGLLLYSASAELLQSEKNDDD